MYRAMATTTPRLYGGEEDLCAMQRLVQSQWSLESRFHIGDIAWQWATGSRAREVALWLSGGEAVAFGWLHFPGHLYLVVRRDRPELARDILAWFEQATSAGELSVDILDKETHLIDALRSCGYRGVEAGPFDLYTALDLSELPERPRLPMGLLLRSMAGDGDVERRVASHRAAWHPSAMTPECYRQVMVSWPYRPELDWMIEVSDGRYVANTCLWHDEGNDVALLEPLGVDPAFRRQGLARAVVLRALHAARDLGAKRAIVYPRGDELYPFTKPLYVGLGFKPYARTISFIKRR
jgi:GNAT superfamily N-acetyltransferase